ncbi:transcription factor HES-7.1-like [Limanda limanda]|uniref:transcription factor HES-7.1-like n=1 Tax=Limanda limanda TaxID=27771 RepID=UPI0029C80423|nr:transcription factor HES-7.1-like [Limanda limanda]
MKLHQQPEEAKANKKSLKPQVERRRRERMNRSMEILKALLLQKQETQRRVEKAEILERTVLFLQSNNRGGDRLGCGGGDGGQRHSFQDGVSSCLQRAAHFLGPQGKGLWLDATFSARFARSDPEPTEVRSPSSSSSSSSSTSPLLLRKSSVSTLRMLINRSRLCRPALNVAQTRGESHRSPSAPPQSRATKQSPSQSHQAGQALWRPWP